MAIDTSARAQRSRVTRFNGVDWILGGGGDGTVRPGIVDAKPLAWGEAAPGIGFDMVLYRYHPGEKAFVAPRHCHQNDQIRFQLEGSHNLSPGKDLPQGWLAYTGPGTYYGPQRTDNGILLRVQFGESLLATNRWGVEEPRDDAVSALQRTGSFHNGVYTMVDPVTGKKKNLDAVQAVDQYKTQQAIVFPKPRYREQIVIDPSAFGWLPRNEIISSKHLGSFTELDERVEMIRWRAAGPLELTPDRTHLLFTLAGTVRIDGEDYPSHTGIWSPYRESLTVEGDADAEALCVIGPRLI